MRDHMIQPRTLCLITGAILVLLTLWIVVERALVIQFLLDLRADPKLSGMFGVTPDKMGNDRVAILLGLPLAMVALTVAVLRQSRYILPLTALAGAALWFGPSGPGPLTDLLPPALISALVIAIAGLVGLCAILCLRKSPS